MPAKTRSIVRTPQVEDVLRLLELTPASGADILTASVSFGTAEEPGPFADQRRAREKLESLVAAGLVVFYEYALGGRRTMKFYQLTRDGYRFLHGQDPPESYRRRFGDIAPTQREHTHDLSRLITHAVACAHRTGIRLEWASPENTFTIEAPPLNTKPDFSAVFAHSGMAFNTFWERDRHTESIDSLTPNSVRNKLLTYERYYDLLISRWRAGHFPGPRPRIRVLFWTDTMERAEHILYAALQLAHNPRRLLVYATTMDTFLNNDDALMQPIFLDHHGRFQAMVDSHPTSRFVREPVRIRVPVLAQPVAF